MGCPASFGYAHGEHWTHYSQGLGREQRWRRRGPGRGSRDSGAGSRTKVTAITGCGLKSPWLPTTREVEGLEYIKISRWCRDLTRFVSGRGLKLRNSRPPNHMGEARCFNDLLARRKHGHRLLYKGHIMAPTLWGLCPFGQPGNWPTREHCPWLIRSLVF